MYALISALSGLVGAIFGGLLAYFGSVQGAKRQIEYQDKRAEVEREKKRKLSIDIITTFLIPEMRHNFLEIYNDKYLHNGLINNASKFQYGFFTKNFKFDDYEKTKFKLLELENDYIREIMSFYTYINIFASKGDVIELEDVDYEGLREAYLSFRDIFIEK